MPVAPWSKDLYPRDRRCERFRVSTGSSPGSERYELLQFSVSVTELTIIVPTVPLEHVNRSVLQNYDLQRSHRIVSTVRHLAQGRHDVTTSGLGMRISQRATAAESSTNNVEGRSRIQHSI